jgi:hypothetical protein
MQDSFFLLCIEFIINTDNEEFFPHGVTPLSGPGLPHYRGFKITLRHTTLGRTPLDECSARRRDLYLTTHNAHKRIHTPGGIRKHNLSK